MPKFRFAGDRAKSLVGSADGADGAYFPQDLDAFIAMARIHHTYGALNLRVWAVDFPNSYKTAVFNDSSGDSSYIWLINPADNHPYISKVSAQPFGSRRAPTN